MTYGNYHAPPIWMLPDAAELARPSRRDEPEKVWRITKERRHALDGDCWCTVPHLAMQGLTLGMLAEYVLRDSDNPALRAKAARYLGIDIDD